MSCYSWFSCLILLLWFGTHQNFFREVPFDGADKSDSSESFSFKNFETFEFLFVINDLFLCWDLLEHYLISFLFPCCDWWGMHLMFWMKQYFQATEDRECSLQEIFQHLHSMQSILMITIAMNRERIYEYSNMTGQKIWTQWNQTLDLTEWLKNQCCWH